MDRIQVGDRLRMAFGGATWRVDETRLGYVKLVNEADPTVDLMRIPAQLERDLESGLWIEVGR